MALRVCLPFYESLEGAEGETASEADVMGDKEHATGVLCEEPELSPGLPLHFQQL